MSASLAPPAVAPRLVNRCEPVAAPGDSGQQLAANERPAPGGQGGGGGGPGRTLKGPLPQTSLGLRSPRVHVHVWPTDAQQHVILCPCPESFLGTQCRPCPAAMSELPPASRAPWTPEALGVAPLMLPPVSQPPRPRKDPARCSTELGQGSLRAAPKTRSGFRNPAWPAACGRVTLSTGPQSPA